MDVKTAAFNVVHDGEGGSAAVAELLGKARGTVDHEVAPSPGSSYKFGLLDAVKVSKWRRDYRILYAYAEECAHLCIPAPQVPPGTDATTESILIKASKLCSEFARECEEINATLSDNRVTPDELAACEAKALDAIACHAEVVRALRAKMEGDLARHHAAVEAARRGGK